MNEKTSLIIALILCFVIACMVYFIMTKECPDCYCDCPRPYCPGPEKESNVLFNYSNSFKLWNDAYEITVGEHFSYMDIITLQLRISAPLEGLLNKTVCMEHQARHLELGDLYRVNVPDTYINKDILSKTDCWKLPNIKKWEHERYDFEFDAGAIKPHTIYITLQNET